MIGIEITIGFPMTHYETFSKKKKMNRKIKNLIQISDFSFAFTSSIEMLSLVRTIISNLFIFFDVL